MKTRTDWIMMWKQKRNIWSNILIHKGKKLGHRWAPYGPCMAPLTYFLIWNDREGLEFLTLQKALKEDKSADNDSPNCGRLAFGPKTWANSAKGLDGVQLASKLRDALPYQIVCFFEHCSNGLWPPPPRFWTFMLRIFLKGYWKSA